MIFEVSLTAGDFFIFFMPEFYNYNGRIFKREENFISPDNRGFRYGDGLFETIVMIDGNIRLASLHFERLFAGMELMKFDIQKSFTAAFLKEEILLLCKKNKLRDARLRLAVFRGDGGLNDAVNMRPNFVIQTWPLPAHVFSLNENGLMIDVFPDARKPTDVFANIKSANYLPYVMAALYAKENKLNDCLVLNTNGKIADATIANVFLLREDVLYTPPLTEGCVAGIMRKFLTENSAVTGYTAAEKPITVEEVEAADEVFLTNATYGLRWVRQFRKKSYHNSRSKLIYKRLMETINNLA